MKRFTSISFVLTMCLLLSDITLAQTTLVQNYSSVMEIPDVKTMGASNSHLYILSDTEGLAVFRTYPSTIQWLYTSAGMQRRGNKIEADTRFAYLYGDSKRLTVLEPTSVLGVYSSTLLPEAPLGVARLENQLYIALNDKGLGTLSLSSPETVDSDATFPVAAQLNNEAVIGLQASEISQQLFVLTNAPAVYVFTSAENTLTLAQKVNLNKNIQRIFSSGTNLFGSTQNGDLYEIRTNGLGQKLTEINEPISQFIQWKEWILLRGESGRTWTYNNSLEVFKSDPVSENHIATNGDQVWISENNKITTLDTASTSLSPASVTSAELEIEPIPNKVLSFPQTLIQPITLLGNSLASEIEMSLRSDVDNAVIRGQSLYWQPTPSQIGLHWFNIVATRSDGAIDSTRFTVDLRSFNSPPRFSPVRTSSIATNEKYELQLRAIDPEAPQSTLIRYIGVDLPEGATVDEETGMFTWTPTSRQAGNAMFKVIATDQFGAASSIDISLTVIEISRGGDN